MDLGLVSQYIPFPTIVGEKRHLIALQLSHWKLRSTHAVMTELIRNKLHSSARLTRKHTYTRLLLGDCISH